MMRQTLPVLLLLLTLAASAQPTWRFHLAFENGDGVRDTIWLVFDTNATLMPQVDEPLGEGPVEMNTAEFNVWMYNGEGDSTKTEARPYSSYPELTAQINAFNWQAPVTIRWDTTMFHASYLPETDTIGLASMGGTHFFFHNNDPLLHEFNMMLDDSVVITEPDETDVLFPIDLGFHSHGTAGLSPPIPLGSFTAWPNPLGDGPLHIRIGAPCQVQVFDAIGQVVLGPFACMGFCEIELPFLLPGSYLLRLVSSNNTVRHAKLIK